MLLNKALADVKQKFPRPRPAVDSGLPNDVEFADDVDILSFDKGYQKRILPYAEQVCGRDYKLIINTDKTDEAE